MEQEITYNNQKYKLKRFFSEPINRFNLRVEFINKLSLSKLAWKDAVKCSKIWSNLKYKKCKYNQKVFLRVKKYDNSI